MLYVMPFIFTAIAFAAIEATQRQFADGLAEALFQMAHAL